MARTRILMVLTSHDSLGISGKKTGNWFDEVATPYYKFKTVGFDVTLASPKGGPAPIDPLSCDGAYTTESTRKFEGDADSQRALAHPANLFRRTIQSRSRVRPARLDPSSSPERDEEPDGERRGAPVGHRPSAPSGRSSPKAVWSARTASSLYLDATTQETLISEVEMLWMLMPSLPSTSNIRAATPEWFRIPTPTMEILAI